MAAVGLQALMTKRAASQGYQEYMKVHFFGDGFMTARERGVLKNRRVDQGPDTDMTLDSCLTRSARLARQA